LDLGAHAQLRLEGIAAAQLRRKQFTAAQQADVDAWQQRNAASIAATGKPARGRAPLPPGEHLLVRLAAAGLAWAQERAATAEHKPVWARRRMAGAVLIHRRSGDLRGWGYLAVRSNTGPFAEGVTRDCAQRLRRYA